MPVAFAIVANSIVGVNKRKEINSKYNTEASAHSKEKVTCTRKRCHGHETKKLPLGSGLVHFLTRCVDSFTNCHVSEYHAWNMEEYECFNVENSSSCDAFMKRTCFKGRITKVLTSDMALSTLRC